MALWPNGRHMTRSTYKGFGQAPGLDAYIKGNGDRLNRFIGSGARTASTPDGYGMKAYVPPVRAGSMSVSLPVANVTWSASLLQGGPMECTGSVLDLTNTTSGLSLTVGLSGTAAVATLTGESMVLRLTVGLDGTGAFTLTGTNNLAMIVPFEGTGGVVTMGVGATDLRGLLSMSGEWTPFTELSPEGLASAVWNSMLSEYSTTGSAGKALSMASSGGVDLVAMAQAILDAAAVTPIHANIQQVNDTTVNGSGTTGSPWGPV